MRCRFCHNPHLVFDPGSQPEISEDEILDFLRRRRGRLEGVVISGGEPTVHKDLPEFVKRVVEAGFSVKLDTNGSNSEMVLRLVYAHLVDALGIDYKHLFSKYPLATGIKSEEIIEGVKYTFSCLPHLSIPYDVRTTVHKAIHSPSDLIAMRNELDDLGIVNWTIQPFNDVEVIDESLGKLETYSEIELADIVTGLHDTSIRG